MANTRYTYISEQILRIWSGGDSSEDSELDIREIEALVKQAHANLALIGYRENIRTEGLHGINGQNKTTFYKLPVQRDNDRQEMYVELPENYLNLPSNKGLDLVTEWGNNKARQILITSANHLARGTRLDRYEGNFTCYPEGNRVYFWNGTERDFTMKFANVRVALADPKNLSSDQELAIIGEVSRILSIRRPQDKQNDGNPVAV